MYSVPAVSAGAGVKLAVLPLALLLPATVAPAAAPAAPSVNVTALKLAASTASENVTLTVV